MVRIRLSRVGRRNDPSFRVVVQDGRTDPVGRHLEIVGHVSPRHKTVKLEKERILHWLSKGAQATESVHNLLVNEGVIKAAKRNVFHPKKKIAAEGEAAAAPATEAAKTEAKPVAEATPAPEDKPVAEKAAEIDKADKLK